jgi:hypothetical protein
MNKEQQKDRTILTSKSGKEVKIGRPIMGYINVFCNFPSLSERGFIDSLDEKQVIEISNLESYHKDNTCGVALHIIPPATYSDALDAISRIFEANIQ